MPNGKTQFDSFDNAAANVDGYLGALTGLCDGDGDAFCHPALNRRSDNALVTAGHGPQVTGMGNDGPWSATIASPVIILCGGPFGPCTL